MKAMIAFLEAVPAAAAQIRANLKAPMPASFIKLGTDAFSGFAGYYRGDARAAFADVDDAGLQADMKTASEKAGAAMQDLADWLAKAPAKDAYEPGARRFRSEAPPSDTP